MLIVGVELLLKPLLPLITVILLFLARSFNISDVGIYLIFLIFLGNIIKKELLLLFCLWSEILPFLEVRCHLLRELGQGLRILLSCPWMASIKVHSREEKVWLRELNPLLKILFRVLLIVYNQLLAQLGMAFLRWLLMISFQEKDKELKMIEARTLVQV